ncbi:hypothetical protein, partial [Arsukibacterium sp.]|uniref:hypothetical protein n=1 Tax=Arsukibacterium sp. TaxID=1977258 RepID=UPI00299E0E33
MKRFLKALLIFIIGLPVLAAFGYWYLQQQIADAGISDLQLDVSRLTVRSASLASLRFQLQQNGARHQVELQNVELKWQWPAAFKPALQQISFGPADITLDQPAGSSTAADSPLTLPATWHLPDWLPKHIQLTDTRLRLPCPAGQCQLMVNGYLKYDDNPPLAASTETRSDTPGVPVSGQPEADNSAYWQSRLTLSPQFGSVGSLNDTSAASANIIVDARYQPAPEPALQLTLQQENQLGVSIRQQLNPASGQAVTEIVLALSPPSSANQTVLQKWGVNLPASWLTQFQQPVQLYSKLHWQVPANGDLSSLFSSHDIEAMLIARAPDPFYLPALGLIQGELNGELRLKNQRVER